MNQNIEIASRDLFANSKRQTRDIKYSVRSGGTTAAQLADYRNRAIAQIESGMSLENVALDTSLSGEMK